MVGELPEELLDQTKFLIAQPPSQANPRRAVSSAHYALFHLLIRDASANWNNRDRHGRPARVFEHRRMLNASSALFVSPRKTSQPAGTDPAAVNFAEVAGAFIDLQQARETADHDISRPFDRSKAEGFVNQAASAFACWNLVRDHPSAQDYLYSLLF